MTTRPKNIDDPCYHDDNAARIALEQIFWPYGPAAQRVRLAARSTQFPCSAG